jgi:arylsulfatase A-like enzyme
MTTCARHSLGSHLCFGLGAAALAAAVTGCGPDDASAARARPGIGAAAPVQHRLFRGAADQAVRDRIEHLHGQPGRLIASWTFSSPDDLDAFDFRGHGDLTVQDGVLRIPPAAEGTRGGAIEFDPPEALPPVFRIDVKLVPGQPRRNVPDNLRWTSARHPDFHTWRRAPAVITKGPDGSPSTGSYEVIFWPGSITRFRLSLRHQDQPIEIDEIAVYAPDLRTVEVLPDGTIAAEIDGAAMPSVWAAPPSRHETTIRVPDDGRLIASTGVAAESVPGSAVIFRVLVDGEEVLSRTRRAGQGDPAPWEPERVDLDRWAGRQVRLVLETSPGPGASEAAPPLAFWGAPSIVAVHRNEPPPTVVLVVADTTRADHLSLYGYDLDTTPFLRDLGERSVVFESAFSQSPWTMPSMCSMMTSAEPWEMNTIWGTPGLIPGRFVTLAESLAAQGYVTGAVVANLVLATDRDYDRGFDYYAYPRQEMVVGDEITDRALDWVAAHPDEPLFMWVHYIDPHGPYEPPRESLKALYGSRGATLAADEHGSFPPTDEVDAVRLLRHYDGEIRWLDDQLGRLYEGIRQTHGREPLFVFAADHGEAFLEHGFYGHGASLHAQETHVPLLVSWQGVIAPRRVQHSVRNLDIAPTILDLLGAAPPATMAGISLRPAIDGVDLPIEAYSEGNSHGPRRAAVRDDDYTYMTFEAWDPFEEPLLTPRPDVAWRLHDFLPTRALYRRGESDAELRNVLTHYPDVAARMQRSIDRVEMQRHGGIVVRLRGRLDGAPNTSVTLAGRVSVEGGTFVEPHTHLADLGADEFALNDDATTLEFSCLLRTPDEEWLLFTATDDAARFTLELQRAVRARPNVILGGAVAPLIDRSIEFDAAAVTTNLATVEALLDHEPGEALVQIWRLDGTGRRHDTAMPPEVLERLRALGYVGDQ